VKAVVLQKLSATSGKGRVLWGAALFAAHSGTPDMQEKAAGEGGKWTTEESGGLVCFSVCTADFLPAQ
jgi:hypothetical protein